MLRLAPVPPALFLVCLAAACNTMPGSLAGSPLGGQEAAGEARSDAVRTGFPAQAAAVLQRGSGLARTSRGFEAIASGPVRSQGGVALPLHGADSVVLSPRGGGEVRVREVGLSGEGRIVERAVAYSAPGRTSYWTTSANGAEEWLLLEPGTVKPGRAAAIWEVAGATPVQRGGAVEIITARGRRLLTVTAPAAFLADGSQAPVRIAVRGKSIELFVETGGQRALVDPQWSFVAQMHLRRLGHTAARLTNGTVVVAGGLAESDDDEAVVGGPANAFVTSSAESYDPFADDWDFLPDMSSQHIEHAMVTQPGGEPPNGGVFVIGGRTDNGFFLSDSELYDGSSWQSRPPMLDPRAGHSATRLPDDRVLVAGGYNDCGGASSLNFMAGADSDLIGSGFCLLCTAEVFDQAASSGNGDWLDTGPLDTCRAFHTETLLQDGSVLVLGGEDGVSVLASGERWSAATGLWTTIAPMASPREYHSATLLPDGTVLVTGGVNDGQQAVLDSEIYDPVSGTWTAVGQTQAPHVQHAAVLLQNGQVMISGGRDPNSPTTTVELYDPATQQYSFTVSMGEPRANHSATLLLDGAVLAAGGEDQNNFPPITSSVEIFSFASLLGQPCMTGADCQSGFCADGVCCNSACDQLCEACTDAARSGNVPTAIPPDPGAGSGSDGLCLPVDPFVDLEDECADLDAESCGTTGYCDGGGACQLYSNGTICGLPDCDGSVAGGGSLCDGKGTCVPKKKVDCAPYACESGVCQSECVSDSDCSAFAYCDGIVKLCTLKRPDGAVAFDPIQCVSGFVADGVCCDEACNSPCHSCSKQAGGASDGVCSPISNFQCDDGDACTQVDTCKSGKCVGGVPVSCPGDTGCQGGLACDSKSGKCSVPTAPKSPGDPCSDGSTCSDGDSCDDGGKCVGQDVVCSPSQCQTGGTCVEGAGCEFDNKADNSSCNADDNPCTLDWCITGSCVANNLPDFTPCPGGACIGGHCIDDGTFGQGGAAGSGPGGGGPGGAGGSEGGAAGSSAGGASGPGGAAAGGNSASGGDDAGFKLFGGACSTGTGGASPLGWAAALALVGVAGARRRRRP